MNAGLVIGYFILKNSINHLFTANHCAEIFVGHVNQINGKDGIARCAGVCYVDRKMLKPGPSGNCTMPNIIEIIVNTKTWK